MINNDYDEFDELEDYDEEVEEENEDFHEVKISYAQYKNEYSDYKTKEKSYDKETKTIIVYFPVGENPKPYDSSKYQRKQSSGNSKKANSKSDYKLHDDVEELKDCINSNFSKLFSILEKMNINADVDEDI